MYNELLKFLKSDETHHIFKYGKTNILIVTKYKYDENNIFLYSQISYGSLNFRKDFNYAGFYNLKSNTLYDLNYHLRNALNLEANNIIRYGQLIEEVNSLIIQKCREIINNDFKDIEILKSKIKLSEIDKNTIKNKNYRAIQSAKEYFKNNKSVDDIDVHIDNVSDISMQDVLKYINNDSEFIDNKAKKHIEDNLNNIYINILYAQMCKKELLKIQKDKTNILHIKKAIKDCITDQKTVTVTIFKDNKEFTFKTYVSTLKRGDYYSSNDILAKDREEFYELFGKYEDYNADEITKITYSKKVLYSKQTTN